MKQRVGIARALARGPELLCMDEPFSALDVFTAESLRSEVYNLWTGADRGDKKAHLPSSLKSIMMITHIIEEAVFLADRIVLMGARPGHIRQIVSNPLTHPRNYQDPKFLGIVQRLHDIIVSEHLPEEPAAQVTPEPGMPVPEPLPSINPGAVFGLMEIVRDHGGRIDVFQLDQMTDYDFGRTLAVVKAGEMLDFLDTPRNVVVLTELGGRFLDGDINARKVMFREQICKLGIFRFLMQILREAKDQQLPADVVQEELVMRLPVEDVEKLFETVLLWGRFGELIGYEPETGAVFLIQK
jgi:NitT/TauT family transport system ATP-binding protein